MENQTVELKTLFHVPKQRVWNALTDISEMRKWFFELEEFNALPGFKFQFLSGPSPEKQYLHVCEVKEVVEGEKISYTWRYDGYTGNSLVTFELVQSEKATMLKLSHTGLETLPKENPDFAITNFVEGWNYFMEEALKNYLQN